MSLSGAGAVAIPPEGFDASRILPEDVPVWAVYGVTRHTCRQQPPRGQSPPVLWHDIVLRALRRHLVETPSAVHIYCVRQDGCLVHHQTGSHNPASIFRIYGPGDVARLRLFTNAANLVIPEWPRDCHRIPRSRGTVVTVALYPDGRRERHMFASLPGDDHLWATKRTPKVIDLPGNRH